jgi:hypothetical protein
MVETVRAAAPTMFLSLSQIGNLGGRISAPIDPVHAISPRFRHIRGVPNRGGGVSLFKLRLLDNLIDQLLSSRDAGQTAEGSRGAGFRPEIAERALAGLPGHATVPLQAAELLRLPEGALDALIGSLQKNLRAQLLGSRPPFGGQFPQTGVLVDLAA